MLKEKIKALGCDSVGEIPTSEIPFAPSLVQMCEMNHCGCYGKNYACPPHIGNPEDLIKKAKGYEKILVFQKIYPLEDSFDFEGMIAGKQHFQQLVKEVQGLCMEKLENYLLLGAGACTICETCAVCEQRPCRFPDKMIASLESYCIEVSVLAGRCGMNYINGQNTVTYFGCILY